MSKYISRTYKYQEVYVMCADTSNKENPKFTNRVFVVDTFYESDPEIIAEIASRKIPDCTPCMVLSKVTKAERRRMLMSDFIKGSELVCEVNPDTVKDED